MAAPHSLALEAVTAGYGDTVVVEDVSLTLPQGRRLGILGRNGAGKTTLLATIMGQARLISGSLRLDGEDIAGMPTYRRNRRGLGLVPQTRDIFPSLTVVENLRAAQLSRDDTGIETAFDLFPRLRQRQRNYGGQLSGGEQQMLAIARTLVTRPRFLLLDEPLEGLAPQVRDEVMDAIARLVSQTGVACIIVEQHVDVVLDFVDEVMVLERGRAGFSGTPGQLRADPALLDRTIGLSKLPG